MHGLDVIIRRNAEQAGREAAHKVNEGAPVVDTLVEHGIFNFQQGPVVNAPLLNGAFTTGYARGLQEG